MKRKKFKILIILIIVLAVTVSVFFVVKNIGVVYKEKSPDNKIVIIVKKPDGSLPGLEGDKYSLSVYENKIFGKKIFNERFLFSNDRAPFNKYNVSIEWGDKSAEITVSGSEMNDKIFTCHWQ
jgi:hypothetical protein